jgi:hypothetical protein
LKDVVTQYRNELESEFQSKHDDQTRSFNELSYGTEEEIKKVVAATVGYAQQQEKNECSKVNEEKGAGYPNSKQNQSCKARCIE